MTDQNDQEKFENQCKTCPEVELYSMINGLGGFIWQMNHDIAHGRIPEADRPAIDQGLTRAQQRIQFAVDQTTRFGVTQPRDSQHDGPTREYWAWFRWWDLYTHYVLSNLQFRRLEADLKALSDAKEMGTDQATLVNLQHAVEAWRPEGDWKAVPA